MRRVQNIEKRRGMRLQKIINAVVFGSLFVWSYTGILGCSDEDSGIETVLETADIIGGYSATSTALDHTGALVIQYEDGYIEPFCTATLIGPEAVVSAKHCTEIAMWGYDIYFAIGPDAYLPDELVQVVSYDMAPVDDGGFVGLGQDVGVLYLDHLPESGITPVLPKPSSELTVGDRMIGLGYGVFSTNYLYDGQRRIGRETVAAVDGLTFEAMFGDFESFVEWWLTGETTDADILESFDDEDYLNDLMDIYESELLLDGDEAVTGEAAGDTQSCYGDSGSPLMKYTAGIGWQTYGVVSGGVGSLRSVCDYGTVFATFGPDVYAFLEDARNWEDPCGDVGESGLCDGNTAVHCVTDLSAGVREMSEENCDDSGRTCVLLDDGARCGVVGNQAPSDDPQTSVEELGAALEEAVRDAYFYAH